MSRLHEQLCGALRSLLEGDEFRLPEGAEVLWAAYQRLNRTRSEGPNGPLAITFAEIEAYCRVMRMPLQPHHIDIILDLDRLWLNSAYGRAKGGPTRPAGDLSPQAFDACLG